MCTITCLELGLGKIHAMQVLSLDLKSVHLIVVRRLPKNA